MNQPGDKFEQEADRVAETVMRMPEPAVTPTSSNHAPASVQRVCSDCQEELQRKAGPTDETAGDGFKHPGTGGRPLGDSERRFFEPRFNRDFSQVRIHTNTEAAAAARSISALAYTMGNDVVVGEGQYRPGTDSGRRLLAHELTHVVQQGAADTPSLQRLGDPTQRPSGLICPIPQTSPAFVDTNVLFSIGASTLTPAAIADIASFIARWDAAGGDKAVRVDGFASTDGPQALNWTLSCDRALMVEGELMTPSSGAPGIPASFIESFAQGETSEFSNTLAPNRRATISADIAAPPLPACANPGVSRSLDLQPIFLRTDPADAAPTGDSWTRRFNEANAIWGKLGVTFIELTPIALDTPLKTTGTTEAEANTLAALRVGSGIEVLLVDNDMASAGGASTAPGCAAAGNIVMSDRGTSDTLLAHELCHTLEIDHPGTGANPGDPGTIADGSGSHSVENSRRNTMVNFAAILCPAPSGSTCLNPDP